MVANQRKRHHYKSSLRAATRRKKSRNNSLHDLPEEILQIIISQLTLKDAARMSMLSRMCKRLWNCHSYLSFDAAMVTNSCSKRDKESRSSQEKKFIDIVNTVLRCHDGTNLKQFKVAFELREQHSCSLDNWIGFAVSSHASEIVLDLDPKSPRTAQDAYDFPFHLFQSENSIQSVWVKCVSLKPPHDFSGFRKLTKFTISSVHILEDIGNLLSNCCALKWLNIICCNFGKLKLHGTFYRLLHFCVIYSEVQAIELHAIDLLTFKYVGTPLPIVFYESPKLKVANIKLSPYYDFGYVCSGLPTTLPCLEELYMDVRLKAEAPEYAISQVKFNYLRHVNCTVYISGHPNYTGGILGLTSILKVAPVLEKLDLHMDACMYPDYIFEPIGDPPSSPHNHLKVVRATGFIGFEGQIRLALYILQNARSLQSMMIDPLSLRHARSREDVKNSIYVQIGGEIVHKFLDLEKYRDVLTIL
ncbi:putative F-box/FBD/LRR-repeat protein At5g56810 [Lolium perenne]|uniref:putative F-box/FBD/LRR-repeat protein At5g56810 n=1 Tax=Lolium perenne TaxID=4522 RepID=UPI0021F5380B|nr:putative F-box protein At1g67390 [Lolium perenne]